MTIIPLVRYFKLHCIINFINDFFLSPDYILQNIDKICHLPCVIVQGRYDVICPPYTAEKLASNWPGANLDIINDAGHSAFETGNVHALIKATNAMKLES